ncbi:MAG: glycosyltransferase [Bacteroidales bacterium]|nr:glycosyltransferase [Bacteroidales bacterium]MCB8998735.1 glycosyltransferase [Bacteroidales bacterium]
MIPILIFVYNRPVHTLKTLEALSLNTGAMDTEVIIYSDGFRSDEDFDKVQEVRNICRHFNSFRNIRLVERERNFGLAENIISAVSAEIAMHGSIIVLEDDLVTSSGFISFMNEALAFYKNSDVFSISAYSPEIQIPENYKYSTYLTPRIGSWGWGTWLEKWQSVDWDVKDFNSFIQNKEERIRFNRGGSDLTIMLLRQIQGKINSWAIRFSYACFRQNNRVVYPVMSLVENTGADGSGTHMKKSRRFKSRLTDTVDKADFCPDLTENEEILRQFCETNNSSVIRKLINFFKLNLYLIRLRFTKQ